MGMLASLTKKDSAVVCALRSRNATVANIPKDGWARQARSSTIGLPDLDMQSLDSTVVLRNLVASQTSVRLLVWTTTPWTLTANIVRAFLMMCVHSSHSYAQGIAVQLPIRLARRVSLPSGKPFSRAH
jgi:hypothetical protein